MSPNYSFERYLNIRSAHNPAWLEGGQRVAFLTDITGTPQVWSVDKNGGWPEQLTFFQEKVWTLSAAPDGKRLICTRDIGGNENYQLFLVSSDGAEARQITQNLDAIYHFGAWSPDGKHIAFSSNERNGITFDVYVQDLKGDSPEMVYQSKGSFRVLTWSPDGKKLLLCNEISSAHQPLHLLNLETREVRSLTPLDKPANYIQVHWAMDGAVFLLTNQGREYLNIARMDIDTGQITFLIEDLSWDVETLALEPDGRTLAYTTNIDGYTHLELYNLDTGVVHPVPDLPAGVVSEPAFSRQGNHLAVSVQSPQDNLNIWLVDLEAEQPTSRKVTQSSLAGIPAKSLIAPEIIHYDTFDGRSIPGFFFQSSKGNAPYPCILYVHGGPAQPDHRRF